MSKSNLFPTRMSWSVGLAACVLVGSVTGCSLNPFRSSLAQRDKPTPSESKPQLLRQVDDRARAEACFAAGSELVRKGHEAPAIEQFERARQYSPQFPEVAHRLAVLYDRQGQYSKAEREYALALREAPRDARVLSDYGYYRYERGDLPGAEASLRKAIKADSGYQTAWVNLGLVLAEQGRYDEAQAAFQNPLGEAAARYNVGMVLARQGDEAAARREFEAALRLDPGLTQPVTALARLDDAPAGAAVLPATWSETPGRP